MLNIIPIDETNLNLHNSSKIEEKIKKWWFLKKQCEKYAILLNESVKLRQKCKA